jgi:hypothetical protein
MMRKNNFSTPIPFCHWFNCSDGNFFLFSVFDLDLSKALFGCAIPAPECNPTGWKNLAWIITGPAHNASFVYSRSVSKSGLFQQFPPVTALKKPLPHYYRTRYHSRLQTCITAGFASVTKSLSVMRGVFTTGYKIGGEDPTFTVDSSQ